MPQRTVDLSTHINRSVERGHPADFPIALRPVFLASGNGLTQVPSRRAVVREDTGAVLGLVSDRYQLVPHQRILETVEQALRLLDVGPVPRGIYVDRQGARMRALFKFPSLAREVFKDNPICPCLQIRNTYDGTARIGVHIGAFHFVCTNLAVGGSGVFASGFMSVHAGEIPLDEVGKQLSEYLQGFEAIVQLYRFWAGVHFRLDAVQEFLETLPRRTAQRICQGIAEAKVDSVYGAYGVATDYATHKTRSSRTAFELLERINRSFQESFPRPE